MKNVRMLIWGSLSCCFTYNHAHEVWDKWEIPGNFWKPQATEKENIEP